MDRVGWARRSLAASRTSGGPGTAWASRRSAPSAGSLEKARQVRHQRAGRGAPVRALGDMVVNAERLALVVCQHLSQVACGQVIGDGHRERDQQAYAGEGSPVQERVIRALEARVHADTVAAAALA